MDKREIFASTVEAMLSDDYKKRFVAEYIQTKTRYEALHSMVVKYGDGVLNFEPKCSLEVLKEQKAAMGRYLYWLEVRAEIEEIPLTL